MKNELQLDERRKEEQKERDKDKITYAPKEVEDEFLTELEGLPDGLQRELWDKATEQNQICAPGMQRHRYITGAWELINDRRNGSAFDKNVLERWRDFPVPDLPFPKLKK